MQAPKIKLLDIDTVLPRLNSQRKEEANVDALADSIRRIGLLHPIVVDEDDRLVAGGNRLAAFKLLAKTDPQTYGRIPATTKADLAETARRVIELEENVKRTDLKWQEQAESIVVLDEMLIKCEPNWIIEDRAAYVGYALTQYTRYLMAGRAVIAGNDRVIQAPTMTAALNILERERARHEGNVLNSLVEELAAMPQKPTQDELPLEGDPLDVPSALLPQTKSPAVAMPQEVFVNANFIDWIRGYSGPKFNLVHCDFPYGINHGKSGQGGAQSRWDAYEDGEDVYWTLLREFLQNRDKFMLTTCHVMFWFSMKFYTETIQMINQLAPEIDVNYNPLIWHKTDNKGIIRDVNHTPRHVYETALLMTRGQRPIIKAVGDAYGAPTRKSEAGHISEKPVPVLKHFFQMFIDQYSEVLDPTAGSGSAIRAAHSMGASRVLGVELNPEYCAFAQKEFDEHRALDLLTKKETNHD